MTNMYFFIPILICQQIMYALGLNMNMTPGKYKISQDDMTGICKYNDWLDSTTYNDMSGIDHRYPYIENDTSPVGHFATLFKKKNILECLQNEKDSIINKQLIWEEYTKNYTDSQYTFNMFAGGLMVDWEENIE
jgi:hypothetical protein